MNPYAHTHDARSYAAALASPPPLPGTPNAAAAAGDGLSSGLEWQPPTVLPPNYSPAEAAELTARLEAHLRYLQQESAELQAKIRHSQTQLQRTQAANAQQSDPQHQQRRTSFGLGSVTTTLQPLSSSSGTQAQPSWLASILAPGRSTSQHSGHSSPSASSPAGPALARRPSHTMPPLQSDQQQANLSPSSPQQRAQRAGSNRPSPTGRHSQQDDSSVSSRPSSPLLPFGATLSTASPVTHGRRVAAASSRTSVAHKAAPASASSEPPPQCVWCRRRKRQCDGGEPSCSWCTKQDLQCSYPPHTGVKRGPAAGVVGHLRGQLASLQEQLRWVREDSAHQQELQSNLAPAHHRVILAFLARQQTPRDQAAVHAYFCNVNNSLFPFVDRADFFAEHARFARESHVQPPLPWTFTYACVVAIGASINGEAAYAKSAASVARIISCALFDAPSYDAVRGFLLLSFWLLGNNQHRRGACCLAIAKRMSFLVPMFHSRTIVHSTALPAAADSAGGDASDSVMPTPLSAHEHVKLHEQLKLLLLFLEDMLLSSAWYKRGWSGVDEFSLPPPPLETETGSAAPAAAAMLPTLFPSASPSGGAAAASYDGIGGWSDLLLSNADPALDTSSASASGGRRVTRSASAASRDKEFSFNGTSSATSLRGGNKGLFEFTDAPSSAESHGPPSLFDGSTPMASVKLVDLKKQVLDTWFEQKKAAEEAASSGGNSSSSRTNSRKRKAQMMNSHDDSSDAASSDVAPAGSSLYRPLPTPADTSDAVTQAPAVLELNTSAVRRGSTGGDLQLDLMRCLCTLSAIRGDVAAVRTDPNAALQLHRCVSILSDGERRLQQQQMLANSPALTSLRALVACMKALSLQLLYVLGAGDSHSRSNQVQQAARQASMLGASIDLSFCPFLAVFFHAVSQLHLAHAHSRLALTSTPGSSSAGGASSSSALRFLLLDLRTLERVARRWTFARPVFANIQRRVWGLLRDCTSLPQPLDPTLMQLLSLSLPVTHGSGVNSNHPGGSLSNDGSSGDESMAPFFSVSRLEFSSDPSSGGGGSGIHVGSLPSASADDFALMQGVLLEADERDVFEQEHPASATQTRKTKPLRPMPSILSPPTSSRAAAAASASSSSQARVSSPAALFAGAAAATHRFSHAMRASERAEPEVDNSYHAPPVAAPPAEEEFGWAHSHSNALLPPPLLSAVSDGTLQLAAVTGGADWRSSMDPTDDGSAGVGGSGLLEDPLSLSQPAHVRNFSGNFLTSPSPSAPAAADMFLA